MNPSIDRDWLGVGHLAAVLALFGAALALLFVSLDGNSGARGEDSLAAAPVGAASAPATAVRHESAGAPFTVAGVTFTVEDDPTGGWAHAARAGVVAPSHRLVVAAVAVASAHHPGLGPGQLSYGLRGGSGALYAPIESAVVSRDSRAARGPAAGGKVEERLVFSVPSSVRNPVLAIESASARAAEVRVPLG